MVETRASHGRYCKLLHQGEHKARVRGDALTAQVYTLEKVLRIKRDPTTQLEFLDEVMKVSPSDSSVKPLTDRLLTRNQALHSGRLWLNHSKHKLVR